MKRLNILKMLSKSNITKEIEREDKEFKANRTRVYKAIHDHTISNLEAFNNWLDEYERKKEIA